MAFKKKTESLIPRKQKSADKRKILGVFLIVIAFAIAFVILPSVYGEKDATESIYVASTTIEPGTEITESNIMLKEVGTYGLSSYYKEADLGKLIGERAAYDIVKGDIITTEKLGGQEEITAKALTEGGKTLITVSIKSNAAGLATHLKAGDYVNVWSIVEDEWGDVSSSLDPILKNIKVYSAENSSGYSTEDDQIDMTGNEDDIVSTITFIVNSEAQAAALLNAEYGAGLHVELAGRE